MSKPNYKSRSCLLPGKTVSFAMSTHVVDPVLSSLIVLRDRLTHTK